MNKAVIIGCGKIAACHSYAYAHFREVSVVDYIDIKLEKARKLARQYHSFNFGTDYIASINEHRPDVISICTPDSTHFPIVRKILMNRIVPSVIFMEKPVCLRLRELLTLKSMAKRRKVVVIVNHSRRFNPNIVSLRSLIRQKAFGVPVRMDVFYYGGFKHNGVHVIDTLLFLFEDQLKFLKKEKSIRNQHKGDPTISASFYFTKSKAEVYLHAFDEKHYQIFDFDLKFSKARLRIENFESRFILEKKEINVIKESTLVKAPLNFNLEKAAPIKQAINIILKYLKTGNPRLIEEYTIDQAEHTMRVIERAGK